MNADGSGQTPLHHEGNGYSDGAYPAWSPDGTTIAFTANNGTGYYHVWSIPVAGGQNTELVANRVPGGNPVDEEVDWAPRVTSALLRTKITEARVSRHSASFSFRATGPATGYRCTLRPAGHKATSRPCASQQTYRHLRPGRYTFSVIASAPNEPYRNAARRTFRIRAR
jgi:hypothetical protein